MDSNLLILCLILFLLLLADRYFRHFLARQIILIGFHLFNSHRVGLGLYAALFFPGTVMHEMAHLLTALALGLGVGKVTLIPDRVAIDEPLGSVEVEANKPFRLSFVGIAPFFFGLIGILLVLSVLSLRGMSLSVNDIFANLTNLSFYWELVLNLIKNLANPTSLLLVYLAVSFSNHMYPSQADLKFWPFQILTLVLLGLAIYGLNYFNWFGLDPVGFISQILPIVYVVFVFTILLNASLGTLLWLVNKGLARLIPRPN